MHFIRKRWLNLLTAAVCVTSMYYFFNGRYFVISDYNYLGIANLSSWDQVWIEYRNSLLLSPLLSYSLYAFHRILNFDLYDSKYFSICILYIFAYLNTILFSEARGQSKKVFAIVLIFFTNYILSEINGFNSTLLFLSLIAIHLIHIKNELHLSYWKTLVLDVVTILIDFFGIAVIISKNIQNIYIKKNIKKNILGLVFYLVVFVFTYLHLLQHFSIKIVSLDPLLMLWHNLLPSRNLEFLFILICLFNFGLLYNRMLLNAKFLNQILFLAVGSLFSSYMILFIYNPITSRPFIFIFYILLVFMIESIFSFVNQLSCRLNSETRKIFYEYTIVFCLGISFFKSSIDRQHMFVEVYQSNNILTISGALDLAKQANIKDIIIEANSCIGLEPEISKRNLNLLTCIKKDSSYLSKVFFAEDTLSNKNINEFYYIDTNTLSLFMPQVYLNFVGYEYEKINNMNSVSVTRYFKN